MKNYLTILACILMNELHADTGSNEKNIRSISDIEMMSIAQDKLFEFTHSRRRYTILEDLKNDLNAKFIKDDQNKLPIVFMISRGELGTLQLFMQGKYSEFKFEYLDFIRDYFKVSNVSGVIIYLYDVTDTNNKTLKKEDLVYSVYVPIKNELSSHVNSVEYSIDFLEKYSKELKKNKINPLVKFFIEAERNNGDFKENYLKQKKYLEAMKIVYNDIYNSE